MTNGVTIGGVHSDAFGLIINKKTIPLTPPVENRLQESGGYDGAWDYGVTYGAKPIDLECTILADSASDLKSKTRKMAGVLNPRKGVRPIVFDDEPDVQYFGRISNQIPLDQLGAMGTFTLQLTCPDPFTYSVELHSVTVSSESIVNHIGSHEAAPTLTVTHGGGAGTISNSRPDGQIDEMVFQEAAEAGTYVIDCKHKTITQNGNPAYNFVKGRFFDLPDGDNTFNISGGVTSVKIEYHDTWL